MLTDFKLLQERKAKFPMLTTVSGIVTSVSPSQPTKAPNGISDTPGHISIVFNAAELKHDRSNVLMVPGIVADSRPLELKAIAPRYSIATGKLVKIIFLQL